ncbi:MAG TPA: serine O-acetyltransferase [Candidatus Acidoferrum sp.]|jgi:serine O-acetyltransferase|nr:serine O-acetyltransferase [Candidatus Acidoferrum sp.]
MISFFHSVREDVATVFEADPAARSYLEVLICYPGLHAVWAHHLSHWLWRHGMRFLARLNSQFARLFTGIEIHPGAELGQRLFIDHGIGTVIGETAIVGNDVTLYQGVTLGGTGKEKGKRHPTLGNNISIGSGAKLLGNITIGDNCRVGAGSVVLRNVPANSTIVGVPGHIVLRDGKRVVITDPKDIRDPLSDVIIKLATELHELRQRFQQHIRAVPGEESSEPIDEQKSIPDISPQDLFQEDYQI